VGFEPYHHGDIPADLPFSALDAGLTKLYVTFQINWLLRLLQGELNKKKIEAIK
jgi:hypothetical protein